MSLSKYICISYWKAKTRPKNNSHVLQPPEHVVGRSSEDISGSHSPTPRAVAGEYDVQPANDYNMITQSEYTSSPLIVEPVTRQPPEPEPQPQNPQATSSLIVQPSTTSVQVVSGIPSVIPQNTGASTGVDNSKHNCIVGNNNIIIQDNDASNNNTQALKLLSQHSNPDAELDAGARFPPPRCHPGTRQKLLLSVLEWLHDSNREKQVYWLYGAVGVGKSAFAQTVAEHAKEKGILGGSFFFSRPNKRNDPNTVFPTIAYRLAVTQKDYRTRVAMVLAEDSQLLAANFKVQFEELILKPLRLLQTREKLLVVLDGLDECSGKDNQCQLADLVIQAVRSIGNQLPVVWMICSRPERHLKRFLDKEIVQALCWTEELRVDSPEAEADAERYITSEFERIQEKFSDVVDEEWPGDERLQKIIKASSGLFAFSSTIIRFIDDDNRPDPNGHLEVVIRILDKSNKKENDTRNPLDLLYKLYIEILEAIPEDVIHDTLIVLHSKRWINESKVYPISVAHFIHLIGLNKGRFSSATGNLHSVLKLPTTIDDVHGSPLINYYHTSFPDFLQDSRANRFRYNAEHITSVMQRRVLDMFNSDAIPSILMGPRPHLISMAEEKIAVIKILALLYAILFFLQFSMVWDMGEFDFNKLSYIDYAYPLLGRRPRINIYSDYERKRLTSGARRSWGDLERKLKEDGPKFDTADIIDIRLLQKMIMSFKKDVLASQLFPFEGECFGTQSKRETRDICNILLQAVNTIRKEFAFFDLAFFGSGEKSVICVTSSRYDKEGPIHWVRRIRFFSLCHPSKIWPQYPQLKDYLESNGNDSPYTI